MSKHTKGPWRFSDFAIYDDANGVSQIVCQLSSGRAWEEDKANGKLIAVAPEMLDLLVKCKDMLTSQEFKVRDSRVVDSIDELIRKVEGK